MKWGMKYDVEITHRESQDGYRDYHALVTRLSDAEQLIIIRKYNWRMIRAIRTKKLDQAFERHDERKIKTNSPYRVKR